MSKFESISGSHSYTKTAHSFLTGSTGHTATQCSIRGYDEEEIQKRLSLWKKPEPRFKSGVLAKYAHLVQSATNGAITNLL